MTGLYVTRSYAETVAKAAEWAENGSLRAFGSRRPSAVFPKAGALYILTQR